MQRRVFYIDVTGVKPSDLETYVNVIRSAIDLGACDDLVECGILTTKEDVDVLAE